MMAMVVAACAHSAHSEDVARGLARHAFATSPLSLVGRSACNAHSQKLRVLPRVGAVGLAMQQMGRKQVTTCVCVCVCVFVLCVCVYQR
jgi:hypothetical protein